MARHTCGVRLLFASAMAWLSSRSLWPCLASSGSSSVVAVQLPRGTAFSADLRQQKSRSAKGFSHLSGGTCVLSKARGARTAAAAAAEPGAAKSFQVPEPYGPLFESQPEDGGDSTVIWLHCGGGNGAFSLYTVGPEFREALPSTSFLFPTGTMRLPFPRWVAFGYDEVNTALENTSALLDFGSLDVMSDSVRYVHGLIDFEIERGIPAERIFLAGFSNGGAAALAAGLSSEHRLGGVLALSTFFLGTVPERASSVPVHLYHGDADPVVPVEWAYHSKRVLESGGVATTLSVYPGMWHSRFEDETRDIVSLIRGVLS